MKAKNQDVRFQLYDHYALTTSWNRYMLEYSRLLTMFSDIRFAKWLESIRKDVKCTFGILKGCFRILKTSIRLLGQKSADNIFQTCCALHNWLLNEGGLSERWEEGTPTIWEGCIYFHDVCNVQELQPAAEQRLMSPMELKTFDLSRIGLMGASDSVDMHAAQQCEHHLHHKHTDMKNETTSYLWHARLWRSKLNLNYFRLKLIIHFDIAFERNEIKWPGKRNQMNQLAS